MTISFDPIDVRSSDRGDLVEFFVRNSFPFHVHPHRSAEQISTAIDLGRYDGDDHSALWIDDDIRGRLGVVMLEDLADDGPMFDLRLAEIHRGQGYGTPVLRAITTRVFSTLPKVNRFEGQTREDNLAMRRTFQRAGFVKEAHYREAWPADDGAVLGSVFGSLVGSVAYAILRRDWQSGTTTPVDWDDFPGDG